MGDVGDDYKVLTQMKKDRHLRWHKENRKFIDESGIPYIDKGETLLFREEGKKKIDFYPSTGRWKVHTTMHKGGAKKFLDWYRNNSGIDSCSGS